jgi:hypothetical protein
MAKHLAEGKEMPLFFYGQAYGFSFVEVVLARIGFLFFGITNMGVQFPMLLLWAIGLVFHYKTLKNISDIPDNQADTYQNYLPLLITLFFIFCPAWGVWAIKARGGYLTAFTLFSVLTYLASHRKYGHTWYFQFVIGAGLVVIFQSQPLFLAGLLPILVYFLYKKPSLLAFGGTIGGLLIASVAFYFLKIGVSTFWQPKVFALDFFHVMGIEVNLYQNMMGSYTYGHIQPTFFTVVLAYALVYALFFVFGFGIFKWIKKQPLPLFFYVLCVSILCTVGYKLFIKHSLAFKRGFYVFMAFGVIAIYNFRDMGYEYATKPSLMAFIQHLESQNKRFLFCKQGALQWYLMFYSEERIIARCYSSVDRYPKYVKTVNNALETNPNTCAIVGFVGSGDAPKSGLKVDTTASKEFYIYKNPTKQIVLAEDFAY